MKTISDLTVTVTYRAGLCDVEVSDEIFDALTSTYDTGTVSSAAQDWLADNIGEDDAFDWHYEIDNLEEEKRQ